MFLKIITSSKQITKGKPELTDVVVSEQWLLDGQQLSNADRSDHLLACGSVEKSSEHPLAEAIVEGVQARGILLTSPTAFEAVPGHGVIATTEGRRVVIGKLNCTDRQKSSMTIPQIIVTVTGIAVSFFIAWFFWFAPKGQTRAATGASGAQEVAITVKGGYTPDIIVVKSGQRVRLHFTRQESSACSEQVLLPDFNRHARLPEGERVTQETSPQGWRP